MQGFIKNLSVKRNYMQINTMNCNTKSKSVPKTRNACRLKKSVVFFCLYTLSGILAN